MAATPGKFWEAIVTMNRGSAKLSTARQVISGFTYSGSARENSPIAHVIWALIAM